MRNLCTGYWPHTRSSLQVLGRGRARANLERLLALARVTAGETDQERLTAVKRGVFKYPAHANLSPEATSFINGLLCKCSSAHYTAFGDTGFAAPHCHPVPSRLPVLSLSSVSLCTCARQRCRPRRSPCRPRRSSLTLTSLARALCLSRPPRTGVDPSRRLTARGVLQHAWLAQVDAPTKLASHSTRGVLGWLSDAVSSDAVSVALRCMCRTRFTPPTCTPCSKPPLVTRVRASAHCRSIMSALRPSCCVSVRAALRNLKLATRAAH